jgi:hypothetical protein
MKKEKVIQIAVYPGEDAKIYILTNEGNVYHSTITRQDEDETWDQVFLPNRLSW